MMKTTECQTCRAWWCVRCNWAGYRRADATGPCPGCRRANTLLHRPVHHRAWVKCPVAREASLNGAPGL